MPRVEKEERELMNYFFMTVGAEQWINDGAHCEWRGVGCNGDGLVMGIYLNENGLRGTIPTEVGLLSTLEYLWLHGNTITSTIPTEV
eukprot:2514093-Ditylum_brightwellii.AAC.1